MLAVALLVGGSGGIAASPAAAPDDVVTVAVDRPGPPIDPELQGFNWRVGGGAIAPLQPRLVRSFGVQLGTISPARGVYDFTAADAEADAIAATGATPMFVTIERPAWAGSDLDAYREVYAEVLRHFAVDRVAAGHPMPWIESGNEPEFPPTAHGELPQDFPALIAAQARAVREVEAATGQAIRYGGPGALFADPAFVALFLVSASAAGRPADFVSWHSYTNLPLFGPDAAEDTSSPAAVAVWTLLRGRNPAGTPMITGIGLELMRAVTWLFTPAGRPTPELFVTEWNLSSGGRDRRNDTTDGAAHALATLAELHRHGADGAAYFSSVDRYCTDPVRNPSGATFCGDWGVASASGERKPSFHAFALWGQLDGPTAAVGGDEPLAGLWATATVTPAGARVLLTSWHALLPAARDVAVEVSGLAAGTYDVVVGRLDADHADGAPTPNGVAVVDGTGRATVRLDLPRNSAALVDLVRR